MKCNVYSSVFFVVLIIGSNIASAGFSGDQEVGESTIDGTDDRQPVVANSNTVKEIQTSLQKAGCKPGVVDGVWGNKTNEAYRALIRNTTKYEPRICGQGCKDEILGQISEVVNSGISCGAYAPSRSSKEVSKPIKNSSKSRKNTSSISLPKAAASEPSYSKAGNIRQVNSGPNIVETKKFIQLHAAKRMYRYRENNCVLEYIDTWSGSYQRVDFSKINPHTVRVKKIPAAFVYFDHDYTDPGCWSSRDDLYGDYKIIKESSCKSIKAKEGAGKKMKKAIEHAVKLCGGTGVSTDLFSD